MTLINMWNKLKALLLIPFLLAGCGIQPETFKNVVQETALDIPSEITLEDIKENIQLGAAGDITYGSEYEFEDTEASHLSSVMLDSTHIVVCWAELGGNGQCVVGVVSNDDEIAWGTQVEFNSAVTAFISVDTLDSTHFVVGFQDAGGSTGTEARAAVVTSGDSISFGAMMSMGRGFGTEVQVVAMSSSVFAMLKSSFVLGTNAGHILRTTVSGTTIARPGAVKTFWAGSVTDIAATKLDSTHIGFVFNTHIGGFPPTPDVSYGMVATENTTYYDLGSNYTLTGKIIYPTCTGLDSTHFAASWTNNVAPDPFKGETVIATVSNGDEIAWGDQEEILGTTTITWIGSTTIDSTSYIITFRNVSTADGTTKIATVANGDEITLGSAYVWDTDDTTETAPVLLTSTSFAVSFKDTDNDGRTVIGIIEEGGEPAVIIPIIIINFE